MFNQVLLKTPAPTVVDGITTATATPGRPDIELSFAPGLIFLDKISPLIFNLQEKILILRLINV